MPVSLQVLFAQIILEDGIVFDPQSQKDSKTDPQSNNKLHTISIPPPIPTILPPTIFQLSVQKQILQLFIPGCEVLSQIFQ